MECPQSVEERELLQVDMSRPRLTRRQSVNFNTDPRIQERGTKTNEWSVKLNEGSHRHDFDQQSSQGPFDIDACLEYCRHPPWGPPRLAIVRYISMVQVAGGNEVKNGLVQIQTILGEQNFAYSLAVHRLVARSRLTGMFASSPFRHPWCSGVHCRAG